MVKNIRNESEASSRCLPQDDSNGSSDSTESSISSSSIDTTNGSDSNIPNESEFLEQEMNEELQKLERKRIQDAAAAMKFLEQAKTIPAAAFTCQSTIAVLESCVSLA